jgi:guanyl-specific ribonuclease Sa
VGVRRIGGGIAAVLVVIGIAVGAHEAVTAPAAAPPGQRDSIITTTATIPQRAWGTLVRIDAGTWPPNDGSGTKGGGTWRDAEGRLPRTDPSGKPIAYREWDVNEKQRGHNRDAERIITGSDGSAWYTGDHYATFARMR